MRCIIASAILVLLTGCSQEQAEEFGFRTTLEYKLIQRCGDNDKGCVKAVRTQIKGCMEKSRWRELLKKREDKAEMRRFMQEFYACIVDENGKPYFHIKS